jgi:hypothetical protein
METFLNVAIYGMATYKYIIKVSIDCQYKLRKAAKVYLFIAIEINTVQGWRSLVKRDGLKIR